MRSTPPLTKERFLKNLEKTLRLLICDRLNADDDTRKALASDVTGFVRQNTAGLLAGRTGGDICLL
jgi:hypothetical protein